MTRSRRILATLAGLAVLTVISLARSQGDTGPKDKAGPVIRPVAPPAAQPEEQIGSRFENGGIITYETLNGERLFALQLRPQLPSVPVRKRDYLIVVCNAAAQAGEPWIASTQIADAIVQTAGPDDRVSVWTLSTPEETKAITKGFLYPREDKK